MNAVIVLSHDMPLGVEPLVCIVKQMVVFMNNLSPKSSMSYPIKYARSDLPSVGLNLEWRQVK